MTFDFDQQISSKSDQELLRIYKNSEQYQENFIEKVEQELQRRGLDYTALKIQNERRNEILDELASQGRPGNPVYIAIAFLSALLGGFLGIIAGYIYSNSKYTSPTGNRFYVYDEKTRDMGWAMMIIGVLAILFSVVWTMTS